MEDNIEKMELNDKLLDKIVGGMDPIPMSGVPCINCGEAALVMVQKETYGEFGQVISVELVTRCQNCGYEF